MIDTSFDISGKIDADTAEASRLKLVMDIAQESHPFGKDPQEILAMVSKLRQGFEEALEKT